MGVEPPTTLRSADFESVFGGFAASCSRSQSVAEAVLIEYVEGKTVLAVRSSEMHESWKRTAIKTATENRTKTATNRPKARRIENPIVNSHRLPMTILACLDTRGQSPPAGS